MKLARRGLVAFCAALACLASSVALAQQRNGPARVGVATNGRVSLQTPEGRTLYVYDRDPVGRGESRCTNTCVNSWPPFTPASKRAGGRRSGGAWTVIARDDGSPQWAYKGRPLYTFYRDNRPGVANGEGFEGRKWHMAHP